MVKQSADQKNGNELMVRDRNKWLLADLDGNGLLNFQEWHMFLHPEEFAHMSKAVIDVKC